MKAEFVQNTNNDLMIANVARVSFNKWNTELDLTLNAKGNAKDPSLLKYLAKHNHKSPFFHVRRTMIVPKWALNIYKIQDPIYLMGAVWEELDQYTIKFRTSYFGWVKLVQDEIIDPYFALHVHTMLSEDGSLTYANEAFEFNSPVQYTAGEYIKLDKETNPHMIDYSMRIVCPIPVARQLFTHRMFVSNEVSRRYVDTPPDIYTPDQWRTRPDGSIKQGSGSIWDTPYFWTEEYEGVDVPIEEVYKYHMEQSVNFYENMVDKGIAPEQARFALPQAMETSFIFTGSAVSWARMLSLRLDAHAQKEIRDLSKQIFTELATNDTNFINYFKNFERNKNG